MERMGLGYEVVRKIKPNHHVQFMHAGRPVPPNILAQG
jgi:hypothetical protein